MLATTSCVGVTEAPVDTGFDVSDLLCAGLKDANGEEVVPTHTTNGCIGAPVTGHLNCPDCTIATGQVVSLFTRGPVTAEIHACAESGGTGADTFHFDVCSEPVILEGEVRKDIYY